jgi:hypothetical protein
MKGQVKAGKGTLVGNAGEYYVMAELLKRGIIAALAPRNSPAFDILATKEDKTVRIRVKTKSEEYNSWQWMAKLDGAMFRDLHEKDDFTVLVNLTTETVNLDFFILPTNLLNEWLTEEFKQWVETPGVKGRPHDPNNRFRAFGYSDHSSLLSAYKNKWEILWV